MSDQELPNTLFEIIHSQMQDEFHEGLAQLAYEFNIDGEAHNRKFSYHYMKYIYENVSKKKSSIMAHTGFSKYVVKKFIEEYNSNKHTKPPQNKNIYLEFFHLLRAECTNAPDQSLPLYGKRSVRTIFEECRINDSSQTLPAVLQMLENAELIEVLDKRVRLLPKPEIKGRTSKADYSRQLSNTIKYLISTKIANRIANTYFDHTVTSIEIEDDTVPAVLEQLQKNAREFFTNTREFIDEHETQGTKKASRKIGFQVYIFNVEK